VKLRSLHLEDFQAHKDLVVDFSPSITTIIGPTDKGKSAILRALRWACLNDLTGEGFIREGTKKSIVSLSVMEGKVRHEIVRTKAAGGNLNSYELEGEEYKAFGQSVPSDIAKLLQLNEINFQSQHDTPFWFSETAGEISRRLNAVIDLTVIDLALSNVAAEVRKSQDRKSICEERLNTLKEELESLEAQKNRVEEFEQLKEKHERLKKATQSHDRLVSLLESIRERRRAEREEKAQQGEELLRQAGELRQLSTQAGKLSDILLQVRDLSEKSEPPPAFDPVENLFADWSKKKAKHEKLERLLIQITFGETSVGLKNNELAKATQNLLDKTKGELCPLCGNEIHE